MNTELEQRRVSLRLAIDRDRAQLRRAAQHLRQAVQERTDVRGHIARQPYHFIAGGLLLGFMLGLRAGSHH